MTLDYQRACLRSFSKRAYTLVAVYGLFVWGWVRCGDVCGNLRQSRNRFRPAGVP